METRFADLRWEHKPISSGKLVKLCERELNWKESTTDTVLYRCCERGIFLDSGGAVTSLVSRAEFHGGERSAAEID